jgi:molecular chaperone GrpE
MDEPEKKPDPQNTGQEQAGQASGVKPAEEVPATASQPAAAQAAPPAVEPPKPEAKARPRPGVPGLGEEEPVAELEPSPELQSALADAMKSLEKSDDKKKKKDEIPKPSEEEMKLKLEILDLRHKVRQLEVEIEKKAKEVKQNFDQGMMIKNQFDAHKARVMKEKAEWLNYGFEPVFKELLHVLDNFERALSHVQKSDNVQGLAEGVGLIARQIMQMLEKHGVKQLQALNQTFDPNFHEAMSQKISAEHPDNTVVEEHAKGYMFKDRLLRPAMVTISRLPAKEEKPAAGPLIDEKSAAADGAKPAPASEDKSGPEKNPASSKTEGN